MFNEKINDLIIDCKLSLLEVLKKMDSVDRKSLLVFDGAIFINLVSVGDIQRALIKNKSLNSPVKNILRKDTKIAKNQDSVDSIKKMMYEFRTEIMPVIDDERKLCKVYFWEDFFGNTKIYIKPDKQFNLPIVVMAGGEGTRLKPLTNVVPKPLIPLKNKTMLEEIFDKFSEYGSKDFFISINYKSELIKYYINSLKLDLNISYFQETKPLGTAGSLSLLKNKINTTFFMTNCDILIDQDYSEILDYHKDNKNEITIIAALKSYNIPYGTIKTGNNSELVELTEKPNITFKINSGMYILEPDLINQIPNNTFFHITSLIDNVRERNGKVGVFPVSEKSWLDIGEWGQFLDIASINK